MRTKLKKYQGKRATFIATFSRFGHKRDFGYDKQTVLLVNVRDVQSGDLVTGHLWFNATQGFCAANPREGDTLQFDARAEVYEKGYKGYDVMRCIESPLSLDLKLVRPTKVINLTRQAEQQETSDRDTAKKCAGNMDS